MPSGIEKSVHYIKTHWKEGKTLKEIAQMHGVDSGNLARAFRKKEGSTVKAFADAKRKDYLQLALTNSKDFGYEIASQLGFQNGLSFYRWTKRVFGRSFAMLRSAARK